MEEKLEESLVQAKLLAEVTKRLLERKAKLYLSVPPRIQNRPIVEFMKRMLVTSVEKFDTTAYISVINFFINNEKKNNKEHVGSLILYIESAFLIRMSKKLGYPVDNDEDEEFLRDACGTLCNLIGGNFKAGLTQVGYIDLAMSYFTSYKDKIPEGIEYPFNQKEKIEISITVDGEKSIVLDLVMKNIPIL